MIVNSIQIKNFFSIGNISINFDELGIGIVVIDGENKDTGGRNGVGKSSIIEALSWALFGRTIRKNTTEEQIVNFKAKKACEVTIIVNNSIKITRSKRPSYLELIVGAKNCTQESQLETQKYIENLLNINYKIFLASVVFGQHNSLEFISASSEDKRTIIKNFLNLEEVFKVKEKLKILRNFLVLEAKGLLAGIEEHTKTQKSLTNKIDELHKFKKVVSDQLKLNNDVLDSLSLDNIVKKETEKRFLENTIRVTRDEIEKKRNQKSKLEVKIADFGKVKPCPICGQSYCEDGKEKPLQELQGNLTELEYNIGELKSTLASKTLEYNSIKIDVTSEQYSTFLKFKELSSQEKNFKELHADWSKKIKELEINKQGIEKKIEIIKFWEIAYSEQGLIKYIIRNILQYFNEKCNYYLSYLSENQFCISFNDLLEETIVRKNTPVFYSALSGGEKRKIDIAVLLALQSLLVLSDKDKSNLIFLDEVADGLDEKSIFGLCSLLNELKKEKLIFVITHNPHLKSLLDETKKINLVNENGITRKV